ncbi:MAG: HesA/MoeB/ThiF family protein [Thermoplasmata archaeon]
MDERYLSQIAVKEIFPEGQRKIGESAIVIIGMGGTGTSVAEMLVRMGVGKLVIVDDDLVELTNLARQTLYAEKDIGRRKVEAAADALRSINSEVNVVPLADRLTNENAHLILSLGDLIMDATDNYDARGIINRVAIALGKPWVFCAVEGTLGYVKAIVPGRTSCLSCFGYPDSGPGVACTIQGVIAPAVRALSSLAVSTALRLLILGEDEGNLVYMDVWKNVMESIPIPRNPDCKVCGRKG